MSRMNALWGAAALALIALAPVSFGQALSGTLTGTVADSTGSVVPKANITVRNAASGDVRKTITNNEG
jgi:hypothetical protein